MTDAELTADVHASEQSSVYARMTVRRFAAEIQRLQAENDLLRIQNTNHVHRIAAQAELLAKHAESDACRAYGGR